MTATTKSMIFFTCAIVCSNKNFGKSPEITQVAEDIYSLSYLWSLLSFQVRLDRGVKKSRAKN